MFPRREAFRWMNCGPRPWPCPKISRCISSAAAGNGRNDRKMLKAAALGIAVIQREGAAAETVAAADVVSSSILDALELLQNPKRLLATLRS